MILGKSNFQNAPERKTHEVVARIYLNKYIRYVQIR